MPKLKDGTQEAAVWVADHARVRYRALVDAILDSDCRISGYFAALEGSTEDEVRHAILVATAKRRKR